MNVLIATYLGITFVFGTFSSADACQKAIQINVDNCPQCEVVWKCLQQEVTPETKNTTPK